MLMLHLLSSPLAYTDTGQEPLEQLPASQAPCALSGHEAEPAGQIPERQRAEALHWGGCAPAAGVA